jgi:hypothetical protein
MPEQPILKRKIVVIYDQRGDSARVGQAAKLLEAEGYTIRRFDETQGQEALAFVAEGQPSLVVSSSMKRAKVTGLELLNKAGDAGIPSVVYSWDTGHGASSGEIERHNRYRVQDGLQPMGFHQYTGPCTKGFDGEKGEAFLQIVRGTVAQGTGSEPSSAAVEPTTDIRGTVHTRFSGHEL